MVAPGLENVIMAKKWLKFVNITIAKNDKQKKNNKPQNM